MRYRVVDAKYAENFSVWLRFTDGQEGTVDLRPYLSGEIFQPLANKEQFARVRLNTLFGTIEWENGADFAPEFLHQLVRAAK